MNKKNILPIILAGALAAGSVTAGISSVLAAEQAASDQVASQKLDKAEQALIKVSRDANLSLRDVHKARFAIFNGQPEDARTYVDAALTRIGAAADEAEQYAVEVKAPAADDRYVPFDSSLVLRDVFVPATQQASEQQAKAAESGTQPTAPSQQAKASDETEQPASAAPNADQGYRVKLTEAGIAVSAGLIPVNYAKQHIAQAAKLVGEGKFYQANLALKAVDDSVLIETYALDETPLLQSGSQQSGSQAAEQG
ncbi:MAG: YfdX family protein [Gammaproteobacteria bacterium]